EYSEYYAYKKFFKEEQNNIEINTDTIKIISEKINRDIYFINSMTRLPYKNIPEMKKRTSIIILNVSKEDSNHYEIIGSLLADNIVKREFNFNEPLIEKIHMYLYDPKLFIE